MSASIQINVFAMLDPRLSTVFAPLRTIWRAAVGLAAVPGLLALTAPAVAAPGDLDLTFGAGNGVVFNTNYSDAILTVARDGRIVTTGYGPKASVARFLADGSVDTSLNGTGRTNEVVIPGLPVPDVNFSYKTIDVATQSDGKIVLLLLRTEYLSYLPNDIQDMGFVLIRFNENGTVDNSFGSNGVMQYRDALISPRSMLLLDDRSILVSGSGLTAMFVAKVTSTGAMDASFGATGVRNYPTGAASYTGATAGNLAVQADGGIVQGASCTTSQGASLCIAKYTANGTANGFMRVAMPGAAYTGSGRVAVSPGGSLLVAGNCSASAGSFYNLCLARFNANGTLDTTFSLDGITSAAVIGYHVDVEALRLQSDGRIVVAGSCYTGTGESLVCLWRLNQDGSVDGTFGAAGSGRISRHYATGSGARETLYSGVLQADGKLLVGAGCFSTATGYRACIARHDMGEMPARVCSLDIDGDGSVTATTDALIHARVALGMSGSAVIGGITFPANARRKTWADIRDFLFDQCGLAVAP